MFKFCSLCSLSFYSPCFEFSSRLHSGTSQLFLQTASASLSSFSMESAQSLPLTLSLVSPLQTCSACECMGCGTNLALWVGSFYKSNPCQTSIQCRFWHHESLYHCEWYFDQRVNSGSSTKNSYIPCEYNSWAVNLYHSCMRIENSTFNYTKSKDLAEWNRE